MMIMMASMATERGKCLGAILFYFRHPPAEAVTLAKDFVTQVLRRSAHLSLGSGKQPPMNHAFQMDDWGWPRPRAQVPLLTDTSRRC